MRLTRRTDLQVPLRSAFVGFRFPPDVIVLAVRWYLRFGLSYRDVELPGSPPHPVAGQLPNTLLGFARGWVHDGAQVLRHRQAGWGVAGAVTGHRHVRGGPPSVSDTAEPGGTDEPADGFCPITRPI